jgi:hypothetical protein
MAIAYLGPNSDHRLNFSRLMASRGPEPACFDDSLTHRSSGARGLVGRLGRVAAQYFGTRRPEYLAYLLRGLDEHRVDCLVGYWGTLPVADLIAVKRRRPGTAVVLNVLCHPLGLSPTVVLAQNRLMRRAARYLDGLIFPGQRMQAYFERHVLNGRAVRSVVHRPLLSKSFHPVPTPADVEPVPNLLFLGRMDRSVAQPTDDVTGVIDRLLTLGVHVYHHRTDEPLMAHPNRHMFGYQGLADVTSYCDRFDASLVVYNTAACSRDERFRVTVPDRLIASVAGGVPVAIPRHGYDACKEYLSDYRGAVIEFDSPDDLRAALVDRGRVADLKAAARAARARYVGEDQMDRLLTFLAACTADVMKSRVPVG